MLWLAALALPVILAWPVSQFGPSGSYTPIRSTCPSNHTFVRSASWGLNPQEAAWRQVRVQQVIPAMETYLKQNPIPGLDTATYVSKLWANTSHAPVLAMTFSGGGWRSAYPGLALYEALDGRVNSSVTAGSGGLFQAMTYQGGLSGGTLATAPLGIFGYPLLSDLIKNTNLNGSANATSYDELESKLKAGFQVTAADFLGVTSVPNTLMDPSNPDVDPMSYTWSGIQVQESFINGSHPMPITVAAEVVPPGLNGSSSANLMGPYYNGTILAPTNPTQVQYEFTPFEYGSWVGRVRGFADIHYMGTNMSNGSPTNEGDCVEGFDTAVFTVGIASDSLSGWTGSAETGGVVDLFVKRAVPGETPEPYPSNYANLSDQAQVTDVLGVISNLAHISEVLHSEPQDYFYAKIANPFQGWAESGADVASQEDLWLVDGGEAGQESPLFPMIQPARGVDLIISSDACGSELPNGFMNGTNIISSARLAAMVGLPFPSVPKSANTFLNLGYTSQPVFFGCNDPMDTPLLLYAADYPYSSYGNISALTGSSRSPEQVTMLTDNGLPLISQQGFRKNWNECLACGAVYRSLQRMGHEMPARCKQCMADYCWNGTEVDTQPSYLDPSLALSPNVSFAQWNATIYN